MEKILNQILLELKDMKNDFQGMKNDFQGTKDDIQGMKVDIQGMKVEINNTNNRLDTIAEGQKELYQVVRAIENRQQIDSARLTVIEEKISFTEGQSKRMDLDITVLKKAFVEKN